jgi:hypothetical protein
VDRCQAERIGELGLRRRQSDRVILDHADRLKIVFKVSGLYPAFPGRNRILR